MLPARLLQPWEVLVVDNQDMKVNSSNDNRRHLLELDARQLHGRRGSTHQGWYQDGAVST